MNGSKPLLSQFEGKEEVGAEACTRYQQQAWLHVRPVDTSRPGRVSLGTELQVR